MSKKEKETNGLNFDENYIFGNIDGDKTTEKKYFILVIYDISDNKRRNRMVKILNGYGFRVQKSAFEAHLLPRKYKKLLKDIEKIPDICDSIRVYKMQDMSTVKVFGEPFYIEDEDVIIL